MDVRLKRVYDPAEPTDGHRVLIDRLWPRGVSRDRAKLDDWEKDLAPSQELRQWFAHEPERFDEFRRRYIDGAPRPAPAAHFPPAPGKGRHAHVVYAAHDTEHNDAVVLAELLRRGMPKGRR